MYGHQQHTPGLSQLIGIALIIVGVLLLNNQFQFFNLELDSQTGAFPLITAIVSVIGGILLLLSNKRHY